MRKKKKKEIVGRVGEERGERCLRCKRRRERRCFLLPLVEIRIGKYRCWKALWLKDNRRGRIEGAMKEPSVTKSNPPRANISAANG